MTNPLFVADLDTLKAELRLSGVPDSEDAHTMIQRANLQVRALIYTRLGITLVGSYLAVAYDANPTTQQAILRSICNLLEIKWTRLILMDLLPSVFMDNSAGIEESVFGKEAAFRSIDPARLEAERVRCMAQIEEWIALLRGELEFGDVGQGLVYTPEVDADARIFPSGTLVGRNQTLYGNPKAADEDGI